MDTLCQSHVQGCADQAGYAANKAEYLKREKYRALETRFFFCPVGFETYETLGSSAASLVKDIGKTIADRTGEKRASEFLRQKINELAFFLLVSVVYLSHSKKMY